MYAYPSNYKMAEVSDISVCVKHSEDDVARVAPNMNGAVDDDDDDGNELEDGTTSDVDADPVEDRRDEVGEVRKMSSKDTNRLRLWRIVVTGVLLLTAFAVTFTTYTLLEQQEDENFQTAVRDRTEVRCFYMIPGDCFSLKQVTLSNMWVSPIDFLSYTHIFISHHIMAPPVVCTICTYSGRCRSGPTTTDA